MLFSGEEIRYLVNKTQCKCLETSYLYMDGIAGDTVKCIIRSVSTKYIFKDLLIHFRLKFIMYRSYLL